MESYKKIMLAPSVEAMYIDSGRFKTNLISVNLYLPLAADTVSENAILPFLLRRASKEYPTMRELGNKLNELYGAELFADSDKVGDVQVLRLALSFIEDKYALEQEKLSELCAELLCSLLFSPLIEGEAFNAALFDTEKRLFTELVESEINNKRSYAISSLISKMCAGEPFGTPKYGTSSGAAGLTAAGVYAAYKKVMQSAYVRINAVGNLDPQPVFDRFGAAFTALSRGDVPVPQSAPSVLEAPVKNFSEPMEITQGKLVMGFSADITDENAVAAIIMSDVFGGGPYSRLFNYVREKLSLCYYCACRCNRRKGLLLVDSGVDTENAEKAKTEILRQLAAMKAGEFTDEELTAARSSYKNLLISALDSQGSIDRFYADRVFDSEVTTIEQFAARCAAVTREEVVAAAGTVELRAVFMLEPMAATAREGK